LASDVDEAARQRKGYGLVRRPTGGRAILHVDELTYSVVAPQTEPRVSGRLVDSYRRLSRGLVRGLELLGVADTRADCQVETATAKGPVCFEVPSNYEVTASGRKLVGSAQMRSDGVVLQHGTVPLVGDIARICDVLRPRPDPERVRDRATTVEHVLGRRVEWVEAVEAMASGFEQVLQLSLVEGRLTPWEEERAGELRTRKYAADSWTYRL
jgi:lipoate-protein ligase A